MPTTRPGYIWSGTEWISIGQEAAVNPFSYQATAPTTPATGDIWVESDVNVPSISPETILTTSVAASTYATQTSFPAGDWLTWTPTLTGTTTNPNIGSTGSNIGRYQVFGKTVHWNITIISGGTGIAAGSGQYELSLPVTAKYSQYRSIGSTWQYLDSPNIFGTGTAYLTSATKMSAVMERNYWNSINFEWATGGQVFSASGTYEAA